MLDHMLQQYGYWFVYIGTAIEADATIITATFLAHRGYLRVSLVFFFAILSTITVSQFWFWLARRRGRAMLQKITSKHRRYARVCGWVERNGYLLAFFSRFFWGLRLAIPAACGATGMGARRFVALDVTGAVLWVVLIGTAGYAIAQTIGRFWADVRRHEDVIALGLLGGITLWAMFRGCCDVKTEVVALRHPDKLGIDAVHHVAKARSGHSILGLHLEPAVSANSGASQSETA